MKKMISVFILFCICMNVIVNQVYADETIKEVVIAVVEDEKPILTDVNLVLINGMGYLSRKDVQRIFASKVEVSPASERIFLIINSHKITFTIDTPEASIDNNKYKMGKNTRLIDQKEYLPLEFFLTKAFAEAIEKNIIWDNETRVMNITTKGTEPAQIVEAETDFNINSVRFASYPDYTRIVVDIKGPLQYEIKRSLPERLSLIVSGGKLDTDKFSVEIENGLIKYLKAKQDEDKASIDIYLTSKTGDYKVYTLKDPERIVIDVQGLLSDTAPVTEEVMSKPETDFYKLKKPPEKRKIIVIDPGHGGKDPGAIGLRGLYEKDVVLDIAHTLAKLMREKMKCKVILTRNSDFFLPLSARTKIANDAKADLFISIHTNASLSRKMKGFEVYFLSEKASDKEAEAVARMENSVMELENNSINNKTLDTILFSMAINEYMNESSKLCSIITSQMRKDVLSLKKYCIRQAGFYVLKDAHMPSVLIETAYISNPEEEQALRTNSFKKKISQAIYNGVKEYFDYTEKNESKE